MPALSKAQRQLMAIAEHNPDKVYSKNRGVLNMSKKQLKDFASGSDKGLPRHKNSLRAANKGDYKTLKKLAKRGMES